MITYTKMFEKIGILPFQTQHYIEKIDWDKVSNLKLDDLDDNFTRNIKHYCEEDLNLKVYQANVIMLPPGSLTPMHMDMYQCIKKTHNLNIDKKDHDKVFLKYWIPLSDKTIGHWFEYNGVLIGNWKANEVYRLFASSTFEHCGGNLGIENRIRLEIIGSQLSVNKIHQIFA